MGVEIWVNKSTSVHYFRSGIIPKKKSSYRDNPDVLSTYLNKYLRANDLLPSEKHSVYSLRHSFQDRLLAVNAPDRVQAELMGHKFGRPRYGDGATLKMKSDWLKKICFSVSTNQIGRI